MKRRIAEKVLALSLAAAMVAGMAGCGNNDGGSTPGSEGGSSAGAEQSSQEQSSDAGQESGSEEGSAEGEGGDEGGEEAPKEVSMPDVITDSDGNPIDLGGMEIIVRDWWTPDEETEPANSFEEAKEEYLDWAQSTYNFTIKQVAVSTWDSAPEDFVNYATTGGDENYVFVLRQGQELVAAMNSGLMYDLGSLDCLDFTEDKWKDGVNKMLSKGDAVYGMRGITPEARGGMYFNKRLLEEAGIQPDSIYDLQENMEWTWDKFEEICSQVQADTDNDGVIDRYAMVCITQDFYPMAVWSNGGEFIGMDENGKYVNRLESSETIEALNWSLDMIDRFNKVFDADAAWDYGYTAFANGEGVFIPQETYKAGDWADMADDFGFVCFPMGPKMQDYTNCYTDNVMVIPACYDAEKAWKIAFAYNLFTDPVPGWEDYNESWKSSYYEKFRDTESVDLTMARMVENGMVTYHTFIPGLDLGPDVYWNINKDNTPAQQAEAIRNTWASYLEEANK